MNIVNRPDNTDIIEKQKIIRQFKKFFRKNNLHAAESLLIKLMHHGYSDPDVKFLLARTYDRMAYLTGESEFEDRAMDLYDDLVNYSDNRKYRKKSEKAMNKLARRISKLNDDEKKAKFKAEEYSMRKPSSPKAWFILGANFSVRKDPMFVLNAYNNAIKLAPNYIMALFRAAYIYQHNLKDTDRAVKYYLKLIKTDPLSDNLEPESSNIKTIIEACNELSDIYFTRKEFSKVISIFNHLVSLYKHYSDQINSELLKRSLINTNRASEKLNNYGQLKLHFLNSHNFDIVEFSKSLRIC